LGASQVEEHKLYPTPNIYNEISDKVSMYKLSMGPLININSTKVK